MRLVVQSPNLTASQLDRLSQLAGATENWTTVQPHAYYITIPAPLTEIGVFCQREQVDYAFVADTHRLENIGLCVMDMDSTLISIECIDEIAAVVGLKTKIAAITERAMQGEIDFAQSLQERVAMLNGVSEVDLERVLNERLRLTDGAQAWIAACKKHNIYTVLVSGGFTFFAEQVRAMLGLDMAVANRLEIRNGKLTGRLLGELVNAHKKAQILIEMAQRLDMGHQHTLAIGDGANDIPMLQAADISIAYHAKSLVREQACYVLDRVDLQGVIALLKV